MNYRLYNIRLKKKKEEESVKKDIKEAIELIKLDFTMRTETPHEKLIRENLDVLTIDELKEELNNTRFNSGEGLCVLRVSEYSIKLDKNNSPYAFRERGKAFFNNQGELIVGYYPYNSMNNFVNDNKVYVYKERYLSCTSGYLKYKNGSIISDR